MDSFGMSCVKYLLFVFNLLFAISGIVIFTVGVLIQQTYYNYQQFIDAKFFSPPMLLIAVGVIVFIVAFFGCCGAIRESNFMLITFAILLCLIFVLEVAGGVAGYLMQEDIHEMLKTRMEASMEEYASNTEQSNEWDVLQYDLACCGVNGPKDWENVFHNATLPHSCCPTMAVDEMCSEGKGNSEKGCLPALQHALVRNTDIVAGSGIGVACVQLIGVIFACCLARSIRHEYETV